MNATGPKKRACAFALSLLLVLQMLVPSASLQAIAEEVAGGGDSLPAMTETAETGTSDEADTGVEGLGLTRAGGAVGDFMVTGGAEGTDYEFKDNVLHIKSSTPMTVSMAEGKTTTAQTIDIDAGVKADLTLAGVNIATTVRSPINMVTNSMDTESGAKATNADQIRHKTTLYLTIADGTTNNLLFTRTDSTLSTGWPGIRCGWGSILVIDDSITNVRAGGSKFDLDDIVTPENGMVGSDVTLLGGKTLKAGDAIGKMESPDAGVLVAQGGLHSAGIGSGPSENAGTLIINGGDVTAKMSNPTYVYNGSGIGGGANGSGTVITINGGKVSAYGAGCGTAIGAGFGYHSDGHNGSTFKPDAIGVPRTVNSYELSQGYSFWGVAGAPYTYGADGVNDLAGHTVQTGSTTTSFTVAGDITVNGGYVYAKSGIHGNAIGQSCGHGPNTNRGHIIRITGGTVVAESQTPGSNNPYMFGIGARLGYTIVTGGSVQVQTGTSSAYNGKVLFQGLGGTAYNTLGVTTWDDVVRVAGGDPVSSGGYTGKKLPDGDKVQMVQINLSEDVKEDGAVPDKLVVTDWELQIDNKTYQYGAPTYLDKGMAYVWVPASATGKKVTVNMSYLDSKGNEHTLEPLYVEEVGGSSGSTLKRYIDIDVEKLPTDQQAYFNGLKKEYDGLTLTPFDIAKNPIDTTGFEAEGKSLDDPSAVTTTYQLYDSKGGKPLGDAVTGPVATTMPADTGTFSVQLVSKQYATGTFGNSYWGHRITAWAEIDPVPAVVDLSSVEWGYLDEATGDWHVITQDEADAGQAGNRLKISFAVRSSNTCALTCAAPTGSFQVKIDGTNVGGAVPLTQEAFAGSAHSTIETKDVDVTSKDGGTEKRHATVVTYYLDPTNKDDLLKVLEDASKGGEHTVNIEYIADKNYIQGVDKNPDNAKEDDTFIVPVPPTTDIRPEDPGVDIEDPKPDPDDPTPGPDDPSGNGTKVIHKTVTLRYGDYKDKTLGLTFESTSSMPVSCSTANEAVAELVVGDDGSVLDENGKVSLQVNSCGTTRIMMEQAPNALYTGTKVILDVHVVPDESIKPQVQIRLVTRNLTHPGEPARPGDEIEYLVTGMNLKAGSAWQTATLLDVMDPRLELVEDSVGVTGNYATPDVSTRLGTDEFYAAAAKAGFSWDDFDWGALAMEQGTGEGQYTFDESVGTVTGSVGTVYGGQSVTMRFTARLASGTANRPKDEGDRKGIEPGPGGGGTWGVPENPAPGQDPDPTPLDPTKPEDILVVGDDPEADPDNTDDPTDPNNPDNPDYDPNPRDPGTIPPLPIIPKDPVVGPDPDDPDAEPDISVGKSAENLTHPGAKRAMVGDVIAYTITLSNKGKDTAWYSPVIRDTLPEGLEFVSGTLKLTGVDGTTVDVADAAYVEKTRTVALYTDDLYGGESVSLTFRCTVTPDAQGTEGANVAYAFGQTPSDRWKEERPDPSPDPDDPDPDDPQPKPRPEPGDPFVPGPPAGTDPDDPGYDPWEGFDWDDYPGGDTPTPRPSDPVTPGPSGGVMPADPAEDGLAMALTGENLTREVSRTMVGDTVRYTATFSNTQDHTALYDTVLRNVVPDGLAVVPGSIHIEVPDTASPMALRSRAAMPMALAAEPEPVDGGYLRYAVDDGAYVDATRTIGVRSGHMPAGTSVRLTFDAVVGPSAAGRTIVDNAWGHGMVPSNYDLDADAPEVSEAFVPSGTLAAFLATEGLRTLPATHEIPVSEVVDPEDGAVSISKTARNLTTSGGDTYVGDRVLYTLTLSNGTPGSVVYDAAIEDTVPAGLQVDESTVRLVTADGRPVACRGVYDAATRRLSVVAGDVAGGRSATLTFEAAVTAEAVGADVGNVARAFGTLPSQLPDGERIPLVPGTRFDPPAGWEAFLTEASAGGLAVDSGAAVYPSGRVTTRGGVRARVLPVTGGRGIVPVTGDAACLAGALGTAAAAVTALAAHLRRRM